MKLIKQILIKQVITENSKKKLESKFKDEKKDLALKCEQLIFEKKKLQKEKKSANHKIEQRFQVEIDNRKRKVPLIKLNNGFKWKLIIEKEKLIKLISN